MYQVEEKIVCGKRKHYVICITTGNIMLITISKTIAENYAKRLATNS